MSTFETQHPRNWDGTFATKNFGESDELLPDDATRDSEDMAALASDVACPPANLDLLAHTNDNTEVLRAVASNESTPVSALDHLAHTTTDTDVQVRVGQNLSTDAATLDHLARHGSVGAAEAVSENENATKLTLMHLVRERGGTRILINVSEHPNADGDVLHEITQNSLDEEVYQFVAINERTRPDTLDYLADNGAYDTRVAVAWSNNTGADTLDRLSKAQRADIKWHVFRNPNTSDATRQRLLNEERTTPFLALRFR